MDKFCNCKWWTLFYCAHDIWHKCDTIQEGSKQKKAQDCKLYCCTKEYKPLSSVCLCNYRASQTQQHTSIKSDCCIGGSLNLVLCCTSGGSNSSETEVRPAVCVQHTALTNGAPITQMILPCRHAVRNHELMQMLCCFLSVYMNFQSATVVVWQGWLFCAHVVQLCV